MLGEKLRAFQGKDAAAQAQFASGPTTNIARVGLDIAVRSGAPKLDQFRAEHLAEVSALATDQGIWVHNPCIFTLGTKP
jgi:hypothetical protein